MQQTHRSPALLASSINLSLYLHLLQQSFTNYHPATHMPLPARSVGLLLLLLPCSFLHMSVADQYETLAVTPPRGWNSYDSYSWIISEDEFLRNAQLVAEKLLPFGYEYVVVDFLWYRRIEPGVSIATPGFDTIDDWGRPIPDPSRWPSSAGGRGFKPVADQVRAMGLKFGIHVMRGISTQAVKENTPILGTQGSFNTSQNQCWTARDIALQNQPCSWMPQCFVGVNESTEAGKAFIQSLYDLYASWEVDYVKHDCVFGVDDLSVNEITAVSQAIAATGRPMLYSISPGVHANPSMAKLINGLVNMYRITSDDWDSWNDLQLHFDVARDFAAAGLVGATGLLGLSWPDLDMLPIGYLTDPGVNRGPHRFSHLTLDEQRTQVTLWAMAKSPLMFGGDMVNLDQTTLGILTEPTVLEINANSFGNMELQVSNTTAISSPFISLVECKDAREALWSPRYNIISGECDQLCWLGAHEGEHVQKGCLQWGPPSSGIPQSIVHNPYTTSNSVKLEGRASIYGSFAEEFCLDAQAGESDMFSVLKNTLSGCSSDKEQIWHLEPDGKLVNMATKLCAVVSTIKPNSSAVQEQRTDFRIWLARGVEGEYYIAMFNLGDKEGRVSIPMASWIGGGECSGGREVWSGQEIARGEASLSAAVAPHGCALFTLHCTAI